MKNLRITKRVVAFALGILMVFSAASVAIIQPLAVGEHQHQLTEWTTVTESTCTQKGLRSKSCLVSGCTYKLEETIPVNSNAHNYQQKAVNIQATCKIAGVETYACIWCEKECKKYIEQLPHTFNEDKWQIIKKASCGEPGRERNECTVCETKVIRDIVVEHVIGDKVVARVEPTCSTEGVEAFSCKNCSTLVEVPIPIVAGNHVFTTNPFDITGLTCKQDGKGKVVCKECGLTKEVTVSKSTAHDYLDWTVVTPLPEDADCTSSGVVGSRVRYCDVCKSNTAMESFGPEHTLTNGYSTRLSTCIRKGYNRGDCIICMETGVDVVLPIDKDAHLWDEVILEEATCSKKGRLLKICSLNDGHVVFEDIDKLEHTVTNNWEVIAPNCREEGARYNWCTACGYVTETIPVDRDAHVFAENVQWVPDDENPATCYSVGKEYAMCQKCFNLIPRDIPKHYSTRVVYSYKAPNCYEDGYIEYACTACSTDTIISEVLPKDSNVHIKSSRKNPAILPTCHSEGLLAYTCVFCNYIFEEDAETVDPTPHTVSDWVVTERPTCQSTGIKTRKCINEGCNHTETRVMAAAHNFTTWRTVVEATCKQMGTRERYCYTCNHREVESFMGTHTQGKWYFAQGGNCKTGGKAYLECIECERVYEEKTVKPGEHVELVFEGKNYTGDEISCYSEQYKCTYCNTTVRNILPHMWIQTQPPIYPDCNNKGLTEAKYCPVCFYESPATVIDPLVHSFKYDEDGTKYCTKCNLYYVEGGKLETCDHFCHNNGTIMKIIKKLLVFFWKFLGINQECECGVLHYTK